MDDVLASKGERDSSHIAMQDKAEVRRWLRHFGVTKNELQRAVEKVGNSVVAVRKQIGHRLQGGASSMSCSFQIT